MSRITVLCGNYGSGKTEISLNLALKAAKTLPVTLVDLDIVNPYFRSSEKRDMLEAAGVRVYCPTFAGSAVDVPALPANIQAVFSDKKRRVIIDVGGDDTGAAALGRYHEYFSGDDCEVLLAVNARRPFSKGVPELSYMLESICRRGQTTVNGIINNTNMGRKTTVDDLLFGMEVTNELSALTGLPVKYISGTKDILQALPDYVKQERLELEIFMRPEWLDETAEDAE